MKNGGVALAGEVERGAAWAFVYALAVLALSVAVVLVAEDRGQLGTSIVLAAIAASGLARLAGRGSGAGAAHDQTATDRVRCARRLTTSSAIQRERATKSARLLNEQPGPQQQAILLARTAASLGEQLEALTALQLVIVQKSTN